MAFQNSQQLGLAFEGQLADFVEEQRAAVGLLEEADVIAVGAGECAGLVAEQLAFHQLGREWRAVDAEHGAIGAGAGLVEARATSSLPEPLSPRTSTRARWRGDRPILDLIPHGRGMADQFAVGGFIDQPLIIGGQRGLLVGANQGDHENVGQRDGEFEIGLAEAALIEIGMDGAEVLRWLMSGTHSASA